MQTNFTAEQLLTCQPRIDGYDRVSFGKHVFQREIAGAAGVGRGADHGNGSHAAQDAGDIVVAVAVVVHVAASIGKAWE